MRRPLIVLLLVGILAGTAWWLLRWNGARPRGTDPWELLPLNTAVVLEVPQPLSAWERFTSTSQLWAAWDNTKGCEAVADIMARLHELAAGNARWKEACDGPSVLIALAPAADHYSTLIVWPLAMEQADAEKLGPVLGADLSARSAVWRGGKVPVGDAESGWQLGYHSGALLISDDGTLLDDLPHLDAPPPLDSTMARARASFGAGSDAHVLIDLGKAQRLLNTWFRPDALRELEGADGWAAVDMRMRPEAALFSGLLFMRSEQPLLRACVPQTAGRPSIARVLPANTRELRQAQVTDPLRFSTDALGSAPPDTLFKAYGEWVNGGIGLATAGLASDSSLMRWFVAQAEDPAVAADALSARCSGTCDTIGYRSITLHRTKDVGALAAVWGPWLDVLEQPWWCALGDRILFTDDQRAMRAAIDAWTDGTSLAQQPRAAAFLQRYASDAVFTWWADAPRTLEAARTGMNASGMRTLDTLVQAWQAFGDAIVQLSPEREGVFQLTASLAGSGAIMNNPNDSLPHADGALWNISPGRPLAEGPWLLTDHLSRTRQVLVQDDQHTIALVSCTGKVLWKRALDGPVLGAVQQVDRFKNGKLQMLFNTADRIYLIDRNGKDVGPFPVSLPEKASAPLSVFDYENKKEYRVLVPSVEAHLLNYGLDGRPVDGWSPPRTPATCAVPVQHIRLRGKDYLVLVDNGGHVSVLDRRGERRYEAKAAITGAVEWIGLRPALDIGGCAVLWTDSAGNGMATTFDGTTVTVAAAPTDGTTASSAMLDIADTDNDGSPEVVQWKNGARGVLQGAVPFPLDPVISSGASSVRTCDINLDGTIERVIAFANGRLVAEHATP